MTPTAIIFSISRRAVREEAFVTFIHFSLVSFPLNPLNSLFRTFFCLSFRETFFLFKSCQHCLRFDSIVRWRDPDTQETNSAIALCPTIQPGSSQERRNSLFVLQESATTCCRNAERCCPIWPSASQRLLFQFSVAVFERMDRNEPQVCDCGFQKWIFLLVAVQPPEKLSHLALDSGSRGCLITVPNGFLVARWCNRDPQVLLVPTPQRFRIVSSEEQPSDSRHF